MTTQQIWEAIEQGKRVEWCSKAYIITVEPATREAHVNHFTHKDGKVLRATCESNYFGSLLTEGCLDKCYVVEKSAD